MLGFQFFFKDTLAADFWRRALILWLIFVIGEDDRTKLLQTDRWTVGIYVQVVEDKNEILKQCVLFLDNELQSLQKSESTFPLLRSKIAIPRAY